MLKNILLATVCVFIFSGCYYTIEPIYTAKDIISDDAILGKWGDPKTKVRWTFTKDEKNKYNAQYLGNDGIESAFEITLVKLGKFKYLDMFVDNKKPENKKNDNNKGHQCAIAAIEMINLLDVIDEVRA